MTHRGHPVLMLVPLLLGGCATDFYDLRLERVLPAEAVTFPPPRFPGSDWRHFDGIVAEFSSKRDFRWMARLTHGNVQSRIEPCAGRTHTEDTFDPPVGFWAGEFFDDLGYVNSAGGLVSAGSPDVFPADGVPRDGRFFVKLQISLTPFVSVRDEYGQRRKESEPALDWQRAPDDLCVLARGAEFIMTYYPWLPWRSNTVVIPFAAIRAALDAAPRQPAPAQGPPSN